MFNSLFLITYGMVFTSKDDHSCCQFVVKNFAQSVRINSVTYTSSWIKHLKVLNLTKGISFSCFDMLDISSEILPVMGDHLILKTINNSATAQRFNRRDAYEELGCWVGSVLNCSCRNNFGSLTLKQRPIFVKPFWP